MENHIYIGQVERGEKNLTLVTLERIARALEIGFSDLLGEISSDYEHDSVSSRCYELISRQKPEVQEYIYRVLCELEEIIRK